MGAFALVILLMLLLLGGGVFIGASLGLSGFIGLWDTLGREKALAVSGIQIWGASTSFVLIAVPLFIFMGEMLNYSGMIDRIYNNASKLIRGMPGSLVQSNILASSLFAACSGSSIASAATIGSVAYPNLAARGFDKRLVLGSISAGGTLGILIPPSIIMIIYGALAEQSVGRLFMAGLLPGVLLAGAFMAYIAIRSTWFKKGLAQPLPLERVSLRERLFAFLGLWQVFLLATAIMGGIYGGIATPTEVASVGAVLAILFAAGARRLTFDTLWRSLITTVRTTGTLLIIFTGAKILGAAIAYYDVPIILRNFIVDANLSPFALLALLLAFYIVMGTLFDGLSMMIVTLPFVLPLLNAAGIDLIWFGILLVLVIEVGLLTPPVGMNLYVLQSATKEPLGLITRGAVPFLIPMAVVLILIITIPDIALWLPRSMIG